MKKNRLLAMVLAFSMLTSCGKYDPKENSEPGSEEDRFEYASYLDRIDMIETLFKFQFEVMTDNEIDRIIEISKNVQTCDNEESDYTVLADIIMANSKPENGSQESPFLMSSDAMWQPEKRERAILFEKSLRKALDIAFKNPVGNVKEDICRLKTFKVVLDPTVDPAIVFDCLSNTCYLNYDMVRKTLDNTNEIWECEDHTPWTLDQYITKVLLWSLNSSREVMCDCRRTKGQENQSVAINSSLNWMVYASIESMIKNSQEFDALKKSTFTYFDLEERELESQLLLLSLFKPARSIDDYYGALVDSDLSKLYAFFGLDNSEKIREFYRTTYALEQAKTYRNPVKINSQRRENETYEDCAIRLAEAFGTSGYESILKNATQDLIARIAEGGLTKEEASFLYEFLKCHALIDAKLPVKTSSNPLGIDYEYSHDLAVKVREIDELFADFMCTFYGISEQELKDLNKLRREFSILVSDRIPYENIDVPKLLKEFPLLKTIEKNHTTYPSVTTWFKDATEPKKAKSTMPFIITPRNKSIADKAK